VSFKKNIVNEYKNSITQLYQKFPLHHGW